MSDIPGELTLWATQSGEWQFVQGTWNSGANTSVRLRLVTDGAINGPVWFDDISLAVAGSANLVVNPSFEAGVGGRDVTLAQMLDVTATDYTGGAPSATRTAYTYDNYGSVIAEYAYGAEERVVNAGFEAGMQNWGVWKQNPASTFTAVAASGSAFAGRSALQMYGNGEGAVYQDIGAVVSGTTYTARAWVRAAAGTTAKFALIVYDGVQGNWVGSGVFTPGTSWSEVRVNYPANATGIARIDLHYTPGSGTIYVDEVSLARAQDVGDERSIHRFYFNLPGNGQWLIGLKYREDVYAGITGGNRVDVVFTNDYYAPPNDRNLYVDYIAVGGQTIQAEGSQVKYDLGAGEAAFDGQDIIPGQEAICCSGALRTWVSPPGPGMRTLTIRARGSYADGWPLMQLWVNGKVVQAWTVNTTDWTDYTVQVFLDGPPQTQAFWYYDDATYDLNRWGLSAQITKGQVTMEGRGIWNTPTFPTTRYAYDAWGNVTSTTDPNGHATTTAYDGLYHLYPVQTCSPAVGSPPQPLCTTTEYYGVNGAPLDGGLFGQVRRVWDANGDTTATRYIYDVFGRLIKVIRPGDTVEAPTIAYDYFDAPGMPPFTSPLLIETRYANLVQENMRQFYDGLGRLIQTQQRRSEIAGQGEHGGTCW